MVEHKDDPKLCTRDTIRLTYYDSANLVLYSLIITYWYRLWQEGLSTDLSEREMMTQLLAAFRKVKGYEERAKQMAKD